MSYSLGIDVLTDDQSKLIVELAEQPEVLSIRDGGVYKEDANYSQVHVETTWSQEGLEDWLFENSNAEYIGTFQR